MRLVIQVSGKGEGYNGKTDGFHDGTAGLL